MENTNPNAVTFTDSRKLIPVGEYEAILTLDKKTSNSGVDYLSCCFKVRADVEQAAKGQTIYKAVFADKNVPSWFNQKFLGQLVLTQSKEKGTSFSFASCDECIQFLQGIAVRITVAHENSEWTKYEDKDVVKYVNKPTVPAPEPTVEFTDTPSVDVGSSDEELPF